MINLARSSATRDLRFFGSPWSSPGWMKTNGKINDGGFIIGEPGKSPYYKAWAKYFVK